MLKGIKTACSGLFDKMLYNFSYLLLKYEIKFSSSPLVYDFLLVS